MRVQLLSVLIRTFAQASATTLCIGVVTLSCAETTTLISATSQGAAGNAASDLPSISADGSYVVFQSSATNLVSGDTNARRDIFLLDRQSGATVRVSKGLSGAESNADSQTPMIAAAGRYVVFQSTATNLVNADTNLVPDIFVYDVSTGSTTRVSVATGNAQGNGDCYRPQISSDGRFVAFTSFSTALVANDTNAASDVFLHDRDPDANGTFDEGNGTTVRVSLSPTGAQLDTASDFPSLSSNGRYVAFSSGTGVYVYDRNSGTTENITPTSNGASSFTSISADGQTVVYTSAATNLVASDTNSNVLDVFVYNRTLTTTTLASVSQSGTQSTDDSLSPAISSDGRYVVFVTEAASLTTQVNGANATFDAVSAATGGSGGGGGTATSYYVYRRDLSQNSTVRASSTYSGSIPNASSGSPAISSDGTLIAFSSLATGLTCASDGNSATDVFLRDLRSSTATTSCGSTTSSKPAGGGAMGAVLLVAMALFMGLRRRIGP